VLVVALYDWILEWKRQKPREEGWKRLLEAALKADPNQWRKFSQERVLALELDDQLADELKGAVRFVGSDTMRDLATGWGEWFKKRHPKSLIAIDGQGSETAVDGLISGRATFGLMSRKMNDDEINKFRYKPTQLHAATDTVAVFVHKDNPIKGLTLDDLRNAYGQPVGKAAARKVETWGDLGLTGEWANQPINLYGRNSASGTRQFFKEAVLGKDWDYKEEVNVRSTTASLVKGVATDRYGLGYGGIGYINADVRAVPLEGVAASPQNVFYENYPLKRDLFLYVNYDPTSRLDPLRATFIRYVYSQQGQEEVLREGFFPISRDIADKALRSVGLEP
jgi:phosphate transport system substrate-binding protein